MIAVKRDNVGWDASPFSNTSGVSPAEELPASRMCRIVPQIVGIVMVAPALSGQQDCGAQEGRQVMHHVSLSPRVVEPIPHPGHDAAGLKDFSQEYGTRLTC